MSRAIFDLKSFVICWCTCLSFSALAQVVSPGVPILTPVPEVTMPGVSSPSTTLPATGESVTTAGASGQSKDELKFLPGVRSSLTYSSNVTRVNGGSSGWIGEVSPYLQASINSERTKADLYATLRGFFRTQGGSSLSPDLRANGQTSLIGDWLWISGSANIYSVASNVFGALSFDPAAYNTNTTQFRQFAISPYIQGRVGTFAEYQVQYSLATASSNANVVLAKLDQRFSGTLKSGPQFNRWGWQVNGEVQRRSYDGGLIQGRNSASGSAYFLPILDLRVGASVNFDQIDSFVVNGRTSGTGLGVFADWTPSNRTTLSASAKRQYYGNTGKLSASHRIGFFTAAVSYDKSVLTSSDGSILGVNSASLFSAGGFSSSLNPVFSQLTSQGLLQTYSQALGGGVLSDFIILNNALTLSMGYASPQNSLTLNLTRSKRNTDATRSVSTFSAGSIFGLGTSSNTLSPSNLSSFDTSGITADWIHNLDSRSSLGIKISRINIETGGAIAAASLGKSTLSLLQTTYSTKLTTDATALFGIRRNSQRGQGAATSYDETAVFGAVDVRF